jgi:hypothetical protein
VHDSKRATLLQLLERYQAEKLQLQQQRTPPQLQGINRCEVFWCQPQLTFFYQTISFSSWHLAALVTQCKAYCVHIMWCGCCSRTWK